MCGSQDTQSLSFHSDELKVQAEPSLARICGELSHDRRLLAQSAADWEFSTLQPQIKKKQECW